MTERLTVLLVDDDEGDAMITRELLAEVEGTRYAVEHVDEPRRALACLLENRHDVCLLDYQLGSGTGLELLREAAAHGGVEVPIIMLTGTGDRRVDLQAMEVGAAEYLEKGQISALVLERAIRYAMAHKRYERELEQKNEHLRRIDAQKDQLLGMAAHDLRSPLGVVFGYAQILRDGLGHYSTEEAREMVDTIARTASFMRALIDDLLDLTAIESGTLRLARVPTDPVELAKANVALNQVLASSKDIQLHVEAEPGLPLVSDVDPRRLDQVLNNLLSNAVKYSPEGTHVTVRVEACDAMVCFAVRDRGRGIASQFLESMFEPFAKEEATGTAGGKKSTGLGLAIVKRIVEAHGGTLEVESVLGEGSTFTVRVPESR